VRAAGIRAGDELVPGLRRPCRGGGGTRAPAAARADHHDGSDSEFPILAVRSGVRAAPVARRNRSPVVQTVTGGGRRGKTTLGCVH